MKGLLPRICVSGYKPIRTLCVSIDSNIFLQHWCATLRARLVGMSVQILVFVPHRQTVNIEKLRAELASTTFNVLAFTRVSCL